MRLGAPELERPIRTRVRKELRPSDLLWREYRRMRKAGRDTRELKAFNYFVSSFLAPPLLCLVLFKSPGGSERLLLALSLYSAATVFLRCQDLLRRLYGSPQLATFLHFPHQR